MKQNRRTGAVTVESTSVFERF